MRILFIFVFLFGLVSCGDNATSNASSNNNTSVKTKINTSSNKPISNGIIKDSNYLHWKKMRNAKCADYDVPGCDYDDYIYAVNQDPAESTPFDTLDENYSGLIKLCHRNGFLKELVSQNKFLSSGKPVFSRHWNRRGQLEYEKISSKNMICTREWYSNGQLRFLETRNNREFVQKAWYDNGQLYSEVKVRVVAVYNFDDKDTPPCGDYIMHNDTIKKVCTELSYANAWHENGQLYVNRIPDTERPDGYFIDSYYDNKGNLVDVWTEAFKLNIAARIPPSKSKHLQERAEKMLEKRKQREERKKKKVNR